MNVARTKHGYCRRGFESVEYRAWKGMIKRCYDPKHKSFKRYGGRGIGVCDEWKKSFEAFLRDMGKRPASTHTVERKKNDCDYSKSNCRWATWREQARNRSSNVFIEWNGARKSVAEWSEVVGIRTAIIYGRIKLGWTPEEALSTPSLLSNHAPAKQPKQVGHWSVLHRLPNDRHGKSLWLCVCQCGCERAVGGSVLLNGRSKSCGCMRNAHRAGAK